MMRDFFLGFVKIHILHHAEQGPVYGMALIQELRRRSGGAFDLPEGTVYPALHRLEKSKLLASRWESHAGRRRCLYQLTASGLRALAQHRREWPGFSAAISSVLEPVS